MVFFALVPFTLQPLLAGISQIPNVTLPLRPVTTVLLLAYVLAMLRGAFDLRWATAVVLMPPFMVGFLASHFVYRLLQLWIGISLV